MKKKITTAALALLFVTGLQFIFSSSAAAQQLAGKQSAVEKRYDMAVSFSGMNDSQPMFSIDFSNQGLKKPYMVIRDGNSELLYSAKLDGTKAKKTYRIDEASHNDTVIFELYDEGKKLYSKTFRITQVTQVQTSVRESK